MNWRLQPSNHRIIHLDLVALLEGRKTGDHPYHGGRFIDHIMNLVGFYVNELAGEVDMDNHIGKPLDFEEVVEKLLGYMPAV
jgi:hypothetical protein